MDKKFVRMFKDMGCSISESKTELKITCKNKETKLPLERIQKLPYKKIVLEFDD